VLEIPTPRWSTIQAHQLGIEPPDVVPATVQERAWTSPIWYTPSAEARKAASQGLTVADLTQRGGTALDQAQLKDLLVGKGVWIRNRITGEQFNYKFDADGQVGIIHVGANALLPSEIGNQAGNNYTGTTQPYSIANGKLVTMLSQSPFEVTVYKLGDTYLAARSNEFGYANYEMLLKGPNYINPLAGMSSGAVEPLSPAGPTNPTTAQ
jgi:hypothetical protein